MDECKGVEDKERGDDDGSGVLPADRRDRPAAAGEAAGNTRAAGNLARVRSSTEEPEEIRGPRCEHRVDGRGIAPVQDAGGDD